MEMMPVYSVTHFQNFLASAKEQGWSILGTAGPSSESKEERGKIVMENKSRESRERERKLKTKIIDCRDFVKSGPTLLVLGNGYQYNETPLRDEINKQ